LKRRRLKSAGVRRIGPRERTGAEADGRAIADQTTEEASEAETGAAIAGVSVLAAHAAVGSGVVRGHPKSIWIN
jgi:hypothetical protein